jgi:hypothetical protein
MYTIAEWKEKIIDLLGTDNEGRIIEVWNECVERHLSNDEICKMYEYTPREIYNVINDRYSLNDIVDIIYNMNIGQCSEFDSWFFITEDNVFHTTNDIWGCMDLQLLHDYIVDNCPLYAYSRKWKININYRVFEQESWFINLENGDSIYYNYGLGYIGLNRNGKFYYSDL